MCRKWMKWKWVLIPWVCSIRSDFRRLFVSSTVIESTFRIKYTTDNQIPIPDIVRSLRSIERTLMRTDRFVEKAYPGIKISSVEVYISNMHEGSFVKDFIIKYVVGGEEN